MKDQYVETEALGGQNSIIVTSYNRMRLTMLRTETWTVEDRSGRTLGHASGIVIAYQQRNSFKCSGNLLNQELGIILIFHNICLV